MKKVLWFLLGYLVSTSSITAQTTGIIKIESNLTKIGSATAVYTLPVVVHVIHNGEAIGTPTNLMMRLLWGWLLA